MSLSRRALCAYAGAWICASGSSSAVEVRDAAGLRTISGKPRRIVALDARHTDNVLALGLQPVGVAGLNSYRKFMADAEPPLGHSAADVGSQSTPNLEVILQLHPDLILGSIRNMQRSRPMLEAIAPTLGFDPYPDDHADLYDVMVETFRSVATALSREAEARAFLDRLEDQFSAAKAALAASGFAGRRVALATVYSGPTAAQVAIFNDNSLPARVLKRLGFEYAYADERFRHVGLHASTVEALSDIRDTTFLYMPLNAQGVRGMMEAPLWRKLDFVRERRLYEVPYRVMFSGPLTAQAFARDLVRLLR